MFFNRRRILSKKLREISKNTEIPKFITDIFQYPKYFSAVFKLVKIRINENGICGTRLCALVSSSFSEQGRHSESFFQKFVNSEHYCLFDSRLSRLSILSLNELPFFDLKINLNCNMKFWCPVSLQFHQSYQFTNLDQSSFDNHSRFAILMVILSKVNLLVIKTVL